MIEFISAALVAAIMGIILLVAELVLAKAQLKGAWQVVEMYREKWRREEIAHHEIRKSLAMMTRCYERACERNRRARAVFEEGED